MNCGEPSGSGACGHSVETPNEPPRSVLPSAEILNSTSRPLRSRQGPAGPRGQRTALTTVRRFAGLVISSLPITIAARTL